MTEIQFGGYNTLCAKRGSALEGLIQIRKEMNHKWGLEYCLVMLGSEQNDAG